MTHNTYRDGRVHVCAELCSTCIFRPGNLMGLKPGRVKRMVAEARRDESAIVCHQTLHTPTNAVCRGFFDRYPTQPLQIAERLDLITFTNPNTQEAAMPALEEWSDLASPTTHTYEACGVAPDRCGICERKRPVRYSPEMETVTCESCHRETTR